MAGLAAHTAHHLVLELIEHLLRNLRVAKLSGLFSARRRTIPRKKSGARSRRLEASSVQRISIPTASWESDTFMMTVLL